MPAVREDASASSHNLSVMLQTANRICGCSLPDAGSSTGASSGTAEQNVDSVAVPKY